MVHFKVHKLILTGIEPTIAAYTHFSEIEVH